MWIAMLVAVPALAGAAGAGKAAGSAKATPVATTAAAASVIPAPLAPPPAAKIVSPAKGEQLPEVALALLQDTVINGGITLAIVRGLVEGDAVTGTFNGQAIPFTAGEGKATALVGVDMELVPGKSLPVAVRVKRGQETIAKKASITVADAKYPEERFEVPKEKDSSGDPKQMKRILGDQHALARLWPIWAPERMWAGNWMKPVPGDASSSFGRKRIINGQPRRPHSGLDLKGATGTPIVAPAGGKIVLVQDQFFSGNVTVMDHGQGVYSMFAHQSKVTVKEGDVVAKGDKIGEVGATGRVTGPHCHWGLRVAGARVDPSRLLELDLSETMAVTTSAGTMTTGTSGSL